MQLFQTPQQGHRQQLEAAAAATPAASGGSGRGASTAVADIIEAVAAGGAPGGPTPGWASSFSTPEGKALPSVPAQLGLDVTWSVVRDGSG
jgi:hypothetical protein